MYTAEPMAGEANMKLSILDDQIDGDAHNALHTVGTEWIFAEWWGKYLEYRRQHRVMGGS